MVKTSQHLAGARCQVKLKMWNLYACLIICGFTREIRCAEAASGKQSEGQAISTVSSNNDVSEVQSYTEESSSDVYNDQEFDNNDSNNIHRFSRSVPRVKTTTESSVDIKPKNYRKPDYVLKIPLSVLRQYDLFRALRLQEYPEDGNFGKRQSIIPVLRFGRSNIENDYDVEDIDNNFQSLNSEQEKFSEENLDELFPEETENASPKIRNSRSLLLLSSPKKEETSKENPIQTFVLPYPRPGRSDKFIKVEKSKSGQLILPYPRPGRSKDEKQLSKLFTANNNNMKYIIPTSRFGRASLNQVLREAKDDLVIDDSFSIVKSNPLFQKLSTEHLSEKATDENEGNSFFVIPYPRPGKKAMFKLRNGNQNSKNSEKEITDYVLPYPRPGKKSGRSKETDFFLQIPDTYDFSDAFRSEPSHLFLNDIYFDSNGFQTTNTDLKSLEDRTSDISRFKRSSSSVVPYPRLGRSNAVVPYPRPGRSNVVPYPRPGRSNSVVPYPRPGRSNVVIPYPRPGRSNSALPYPQIRRSEAVVPYPRLGRSVAIAHYPYSLRSKRSSSVVPYPRLGRSDSVVPYPRLGRSESVVPYPRLGRGESVVPYPRPGRSDSVVPYPRLGRAYIVKPVSSDKYSSMENWFFPNLRSSHSTLKQDTDATKEDFAKNIRLETPVYKDNFEYTDTNRNSLSEMNSFRDNRAINDQGYVLPYPRVGRSTFKDIKKRDYFDTDTVIPYPRLGRSQKETLPNKSPPEGQNSVHKLNKHVLSSVEDSVYLLPYPRPGRHSK